MGHAANTSRRGAQCHPPRGWPGELHLLRTGQRFAKDTAFQGGGWGGRRKRSETFLVKRQREGRESPGRRASGNALGCGQGPVWGWRGLRRVRRILNLAAARTGGPPGAEKRTLLLLLSMRSLSGTWSPKCGLAPPAAEPPEGSTESIDVSPPHPPEQPQRAGAPRGSLGGGQEDTAAPPKRAGERRGYGRRYPGDGETPGLRWSSP